MVGAERNVSKRVVSPESTGNMLKRGQNELVIMIIGASMKVRNLKRNEVIRVVRIARGTR